MGMLGALAAVAIVSTLIVLSFKLVYKTVERDTARTLGNRLMVYNNAVRSFLAMEGSTTPTATYTGVDWLRVASCGGTSATRYLSCAFNPVLPWGLTLTTVVTNYGTYTDAVTTVGPIPDASGNPRLDLAGLAALTANGAHVSSQTPVSATFYAYSVTVTGQVQATASTNNSLDAWLRTDGSNQMNAALNMGGNDINNAATVNASTAVQTPVVKDSDDTNYYVDPAGTSVLKDVTITGDIYLQGTDQYVSQGVYYETIAWDGSLINKPTCVRGVPWATAAVERAQSAWTAESLGAIDPYMEDYSATQWKVRFKILTKDGWAFVSSPYSRVKVSVKCQS